MKNLATPRELNISASALLIILIFVSTFSISQNPMVISDSLIIMNRVYAKEKLIVDQEAKFKQDIKVLGSARILTDLRVDSTLRVDGNAKFNGSVKMEGLGNAGTLDANSEIVIIMPNGQLKKGPLGVLYVAANTPPAELNLCGANGGNGHWWTGPNKLYTGCPETNVGIATSNPQHKLHVNSGNIFGQKMLTGNSLGTTDALYNGFAINNTQDLMQLGVKVGALTQTVKFRIQNKGSIQTSNSGSAPSLMMNNGTGHAAVIYANNGIKILQLEDNGMLRAREIKVDQNTWADYVFDKNYKLSSLKSVAKYINKNHHLPGVPTAKEIEADGLNLGDMQKIQMEKIEELYLHLIEMDEKMSVMETRMNELERENSELKKLSK